MLFPFTTIPQCQLKEETWLASDQQNMSITLWSFKAREISQGNTHRRVPTGTDLGATFLLPAVKETQILVGFIA